jgi:hypothetical protein
MRACKFLGLDRTKLFHVKRFGTIEALFRTKTIAVFSPVPAVPYESAAPVSRALGLFNQEFDEFENFVAGQIIRHRKVLFAFGGEGQQLGASGSVTELDHPGNYFSGVT